MTTRREFIASAALAAADADGNAVVSIGPAYRTVWYEVAVKGNR